MIYIIRSFLGKCERFTHVQFFSEIDETCHSVGVLIKRSTAKCLEVVNFALSYRSSSHISLVLQQFSLTHLGNFPLKVIVNSIDH